MQVAGLAVDQFAKHPLAYHAEHQQLAFTVAAVFQHHAMPLRLLGRIDQLPALIQRDCGRHFDHGVLAVLHRADCHAHMPIPGRGNINHVDILAPAEVLEVGLALGIAGRLRLAFRHDTLLDPLYPLRHQVADRLDRDAFNIEQVVQQSRTARPNPDKTDPDRAERRCLQPEHALLRRPAWGGNGTRASGAGHTCHPQAGARRCHSEKLPARERISFRCFFFHQKFPFSLV